MKGLQAVRLPGSVLLLLLAVSGCGYKNGPVPPESVVPLAIADLHRDMDEKGVQLSWSYPVRTISNRELEDISAFDLYRAEISLEDYCSSCPVPYGEPIRLDGGPTYDGKERRTARFRDSLLQPGYKYFFKVRSRTSWWADSADSNIVSFVWFTPARGPTGLTATPGDRQVLLRWQPVTRLTDSSEVPTAMKYQLARSTDGKGYQALGEPLATTEYVDRQVTNGVRYFYTVRSLMVLEEELVSGGLSEAVDVAPVDLTPPEPPTGIRVVRTGVGTKVFWEANAAEDLGGYTIYRRAASEKNFTAIGSVEAAYTLFVDSKAKAGVLYFYGVSAFDSADPPNESRKSKQASARY